MNAATSNHERASMKTIGISMTCIALAFTSAADADDHVWSSLGGGSFNHWLNWVPQYVPGEDDNAIFELGMDPAYEVTFYEGVTNDKCIFRTDKVVMDLGSFTYYLDNPGQSLVVGESNGHFAEVLLYHGDLDADTVHVGLWEGSNGTLDLESGLTMNVSNYLTVANDGDGQLTIYDGASVTTEYATIGSHDFGNTGVIDVVGSDAEFTINQILTVGGDGAGTLNIVEDGSASPLHVNIGGGTGVGIVNVAGASELSVGNSLTIGVYGAGTLLVEDAGQASAPGIIRVGWFDGSTGDATVTGEYSTISTDGTLAVGDGGTGTMLINDAATADAHTLVMGWVATGDGTLTVSDAGTALTADDALWIGSGGDASCTIQAGASASANYVCVGAVDAADGDLTVTGENTTLTVTNDLDVGQDAIGDLAIEDQAQVDVTAVTRIGRSANGVGNLTASGAGTSLSTGDCVIGEAGDGTLTISEGADVDVRLAFVGTIPSGVGHLELSGAGSTLDAAEYIRVGNEGDATANITQQAALAAETLLVGVAGTSVGELNVADAGTTVTVLNNIQVGQWGSGVMNITNGAEVKTTEPGGWIVIADQVDADGTVLVDGGSTLTAEQAPIVVGSNGHAEMTITGGSQVYSSGELFMGGGADCIGQLTISGPDSEYVSASGYAARIGNHGGGTLIIENGGYFEKPGGFILGDNETGVGTINLNGAASLFKTERLTVGEYGVGVVNINDGRVSLGVEDPSTIPSGELHMFGYGHLSGTGTVAGDVVNFNCEVKPGGGEEAALTGVLTIDGDYTQQYATLKIKVKGTTLSDEYSSLNVTGVASLDHDLVMEPVDGYFPLPGEQYVVLTAASIIDAFGRVTGPGNYDITYNADSVTITVINSPGDLDGDRDVDLSDLATLLAFYGTPSGAEYSQGDVDGDGDVDLSDLASLLAYYGMAG